MGEAYEAAVEAGTVVRSKANKNKRKRIVVGQHDGFVYMCLHGDPWSARVVRSERFWELYEVVR